MEVVRHKIIKEEVGGTQIFLFADNYVTDQAIFKGFSSSKVLFGLVLRLRKLEISVSVQIFVMNILGESIKDQGTDGLLQGAVLVRVMKGKFMLEFVALKKISLEVS